MPDILEERLGLYYPYVHFRDDDWLKKTLLVFPGLVRMVADDQVPHDSDFVSALLRDQNGPLVRRADLHTDHVSEVQTVLLRLIQEDLERHEDFAKNYGKAATMAAGGVSFQMNLGKTSPGIAEFLLDQELAWSPSDPEHKSYSELNPKLGRAVLGTIAVACAEDAGLHIVASAADEPSRELNVCLASGDVEKPYRTLVRNEPLVSTGPLPSTDVLWEFIVQFNCDVKKLNIQGLKRLSGEREALRNLKAELQKLAATIPPMNNQAALDERLRDEASRVLNKWKQDKANLPNFAKAFFGLENVAKGGGEFLKSALDNIYIKPGGIAALTAGTLLGAGAGLGIGVLVHAASTAAKVIDTERKSRFRYMTQAEKYGVVFSIGA